MGTKTICCERDMKTGKNAPHPVSSQKHPALVMNAVEEEQSNLIPAQQNEKKGGQLCSLSPSWIMP